MTNAAVTSPAYPMKQWSKNDWLEEFRQKLDGNPAYRTRPPRTIRNINAKLSMGHSASSAEQEALDAWEELVNG